MPKMVFLGSFWKLKAYVKQCYKTGHFQYYKKLMENAKSGQFWGIFEYLKLMSNSDTRHVYFDISKIDGKCQNWKIEKRHFGWFWSISSVSKMIQKWILWQNMDF